MKIEALKIIEWEIFQQIAKNFLKINFLSLDKYLTYLTGEGVSVIWHQLENWEDLEDEEIYEKIESLQLPVGKIHVITEACYKNNHGPFELDASALRELVLKHLDKFGECFFNGDVVIFSFEHNMVWCFHHEGLYSLIKLN